MRVQRQVSRYSSHHSNICDNRLQIIQFILTDNPAIALNSEYAAPVFIMSGIVITFIKEILFKINKCSVNDLEIRLFIDKSKLFSGGNNM